MQQRLQHGAVEVFAPAAVCGAATNRLAARRRGLPGSSEAASNASRSLPATRDGGPTTFKAFCRAGDSTASYFLMRLAASASAANTLLLRHQARGSKFDHAIPPTRRSACGGSASSGRRSPGGIGTL